MLNNYQYDLFSGWKRLDHDPLPEQRQNQPWEKYFEENGYYSFGETIGCDYSWSLVVRSVNDKSEVKPEFSYVVEIGNASECRLVFCADFLSASELMRQFAPLVTADLLTDVHEAAGALIGEERQRTEEVQRAMRTRRTG